MQAQGSSSSEVTGSNGGTISMNGNITVKALWRNASRTVTFDANGHGTAPDSQTVEHGGKASDPEAPQKESYTIESKAITLTNSTRTGYDFAGWTGTELDDATETVTIPQGSTGNLEFTAT